MSKLMQRIPLTSRLMPSVRMFSVHAQGLHHRADRTSVTFIREH